MEIVARKVIAIFLKLLGRKTFDTVEQGVSTVVHQWFGGSKLHDPLTRFASRLGFRACFVAGTPIRTLDGSKPIEEFKSYEEHGDDCDYVLARSEFDPNGPVRARRVLRKFVRVAPVLNLHIGGRVIGTTAEHPFFVEGKGWTPAFDLRIGDRVLLEDGQCLRVEGIGDSGRVETVYNIEVENDHTYFVGEKNWGWAVWSHNATYAEILASGARVILNNVARKVPKVDFLFSGKNAAQNWAVKHILGGDYFRIYNPSGKWIGWANRHGDKVYWGHGDWGLGKGASRFPHLNYELRDGTKGHLFLEDKLRRRGMNPGFRSTFKIE